MATVGKVTIVSDEGTAKRQVVYSIDYKDNAGGDFNIVRKVTTTDQAFNASSYGTKLANHHLEILEKSEAAKVDADFKEGKDPLAASTNTKWSTSKDKIYKYVIWALKERDLRVFIWMKPLIDDLRANYTPTTLANYLGITVDDANAFEERAKAIFDKPILSSTALSLISDFDANERDIE